MAPYRNDIRKCVVSYRNCTVACYRTPVVRSLIVIVIVIPCYLSYVLLSSSVMLYSPI